MINLLEHCLKKIDLSSYGRGSRNKGTELITSSIENFASGQRVECEKEVFLGLRRKRDGHKGLVDIIIRSPDGIRYAIEIDSSNKKWSLEKLLHAHSIGYVPIWVRWNAEININVPVVINLIDLTNKQR
ncbi:MAG: hypothetical protein A2173_01835 [Planctomycetes bacterium RBG_13_44_8b]|nr:MAG: hypothetical protein A2173_01835 [Planctomycetes bacterium RBG_13_44_8b]